MASRKAPALKRIVEEMHQPVSALHHRNFKLSPYYHTTRLNIEQ